MGKKSRHPFLRRRGEVWWIRVAVPKAVRHLYTSPHVEQSLGTKSITEAEQMKFARLGSIKLTFRQQMKDETGSLATDVKLANEMRRHYESAEDDFAEAIISGVIVDEAERIEAKAGIERAQLFVARAVGRKTLREAWDDWITSADLKKGTQAKYRRAFDEFLRYLQQPDMLPDAATADRVQAYVEWLNTKATNAKGEPLDPDTKRGRINALGVFWKYLQHRQLIPRGPNPWQGHTLTGARLKARRQKAERPYTDEELLSVIHGPERRPGSRYTKRTMIELTALGLYTGARLDELCSRTIGDFEPIKGGYVMHIREAKTPGGVRSLPIVHPIPVAVIQGRIGKRKDVAAFLFAEFVAGGPDYKRSWQVQKALGDYRRAVGLPHGVDFHSTRRTFATVMERQGIDQRWTERYFGHRPAGLMAGTYAGVSPQSLRKVAEAIQYSANVEEAFRSALGVE